MSKKGKIIIIVLIVLIVGFFLIKNQFNNGSKDVKPYVEKGYLIMSTDTNISTIYYFGVDGQRYVIPNDATFFTWFTTKENIKKLSPEELGQIPFGAKNVTYKPNTRLLTITSDPRVYWVDVGGVLREISSTNLLTELFGADWQKLVDNLPEEYFSNYTIGKPITKAKLPVVDPNITIGQNLGL